MIGVLGGVVGVVVMSGIIAGGASTRIIGDYCVDKCNRPAGTKIITPKTFT